MITLTAEQAQQIEEAIELSKSIYRVHGVAYPSAYIDVLATIRVARAREQLVALALEAGFEIDGAALCKGYVHVELDELERFAALVVARERDSIMEIVNTIGGEFAEQCAAAIRVRGEK